MIILGELARPIDDIGDYRNSVWNDPNDGWNTLSDIIDDLSDIIEREKACIAADNAAPVIAPRRAAA